MTIFQTAEFRDHERVIFIRDRAVDLRAIIAIHRSVSGTAGGGVRMKPYSSEARAITDVLRLSRAMTYKFSLAGIAMGGAKSVIIGDPASDKTPEFLEAFGGVVQRLNGAFICAPDVGTTCGDMAIIRRATEHVRGLPGASGETAPATAYGVYQGIRAAVKHKLGRDDLRGLTVAVQGAGAVGSNLCRHLDDAGCALMVADIDDRAVARMVEAHGATAIAPDRVLSAAVDILAPCALGGCLDDDTIPLIRAAIVCGGANNQLAADRHGAMLEARDILYAPDYVVNAGGTMNAVREGPDYDESEAMCAVGRIYDTLMMVFAHAVELGIPSSVAADQLAEQNLENQTG